MTFEYLAASYFLLIAVLAPLSGASARRAAAVMLAACGAAASIIGVMHAVPLLLRVWAGGVYLGGGYWLPALLVTRSPGAFEAWLQRCEPGAARTLWVGGSAGEQTARVWTELAYLCCYPLVPAAFIAVYISGSADDLDRFWTAVLGSGFFCYISLPWLVSRPPRILESRADPSGPRSRTSSAVRRINLRVLDDVSHGWNTFPSGHVAIAIAAALAVTAVSPVAGMAFLVVACGVAVGSVSGRYHYVVDAVAGLVVAVAAYAVSAYVVAGFSRP